MTQANLFEQQNEPAGDAAETLTLSTFAERAYLDYAVSVVKGRAYRAYPWDTALRLVDHCLASYPSPGAPESLRAQ